MDRIEDELEAGARDDDDTLDAGEIDSDEVDPEEIDAGDLVGESEHSVRSSGQRGLSDEDDLEDRLPSTSPEDGLSISPDDLGEKYLENATESATIPRHPPDRDRS